MKYFLCIDCGLTKLKAVLQSISGEMLCERCCDTPVSGDLIDVKKIKHLLVEMIGAMITQNSIDAEDILAVSTSGHGNGVYILDKNGECSCGYSSMFTHSQPYTPKTELTFPITMQTSWSGQPLAILSYIKNKKPQLFSAIDKIMLCKDVIKFILTDTVTTDYTDASAAGLLNGKTSDYDKNLFKIYGLEDHENIFPKLCKCTDVIGNISEEFSKLSGLSKKTLVVGGLFDVNSCMLGSGVTEANKYAIIAGTWGINSAVSNTPVLNDSITECCIFTYPGQYVCIDSAPTSCGNLEWFLRNVVSGLGYEEVNKIVLQQPTDKNLLYFPYIYKPMDLHMQGGFLGLNADHTYKDMLRAIYEGIVFEHTYRLEKLKNAGICYNSAALTGGAANSEVFCRMFADITGLEIHTTSQSQAGALGGAMICSVATGMHGSIKAAAEEMVKPKDIFYPEKNDYYKEKFELFKKIITKREESSL